MIDIHVGFSNELQLNKANSADTKPAYLDLYLLILSKTYENCNDFDFDIVYFQFLDGDVPRAPSDCVSTYSVI